MSHRSVSAASTDSDFAQRPRSSVPRKSGAASQQACSSPMTGDGIGAGVFAATQNAALPRHSTAALRSPRTPRLSVYSIPRGEEEMLKALSMKDARALLAQLDSERLRYVQAQRFDEAQQCVVRMELIASSQGRQAVDAVQRKAVECPERDVTREEQRQRIFQFTTMWEEAMQNFEGLAATALNGMRKRHAGEYAEKEAQLRQELTGKRLHFSRRVLHARAELNRLVEGKKYGEASVMQKQLEQLEANEGRKFEEKTSAALGAKTRHLKQLFSNELEALSQRISSERDALRCQRKRDYGTLLQKHMNEVSHIDLKNRTQTAKEKAQLQRQLDALLGAPSKERLAAMLEAK